MNFDQYFKDKNEIISKAIDLQYEDDFAKVHQIHKESKDAIDEMMRITKYFTEKLNQMNPSYIYDIQKYYPEVWGACHEKETGYVLSSITRNLHRGIQNGLYRSKRVVEVNLPISASKLVLVMKM